MKSKNFTKGVSLFILFFFLLVYRPKANITAIVTALALFVSFFRTLDWEGLIRNRYVANAFIVALLAAAICTLKANFIPACAMLFIFSYLFYIITSKKPSAFYEFLIASVFVGIFLLPWMISMYVSSGTLLYPIFGKGYHGSAYGGTFTVPWSWSEFSIINAIKILIERLRSPSFFTVLYLLTFYHFITRSAKLVEREAALSLLISSLLGSLPFLWGSMGYLERYTFSFMFAAIIVLMISALSDAREEKTKKYLKPAALLIVGCIAGLLINKAFFLEINRNSIVKNFKFAISSAPLVSDKEAFQYAKMQQSIPEGETVLTRLSNPFLLDFTRNRIYIADWPGGASLPPGMPAFKGAEALADYLVSKSIRYVTYSYAEEANFSWEKHKKLLDFDSWHETNASHTFDFQDNLSALGNTRKRIYDDGEIFVLDLLSRTK